MEVSALSGPANDSKSTSALGNLSSNFDNFLTLLTQQLMNQDPLSPMETNEFTTQLVQFTGVEQSILTNTRLEQMLRVQLADQTMGAVGLIGKEITAAGNTASLANGEAKFSYTLSANAASAKYTIRNGDGDVVLTGSGPTTAGSHEISWNGVTGNNTIAPDGTYTIGIEALDANGDPVDAKAGIVGVVTGVESRDGQPAIMIGALAIKLEDITSVRATTSTGGSDAESDTTQS